MSKKLRFHLFGPFEIFRDGQPLTNQDWQSQQTRTVCKLLVARQGQVVSSDQIIDILWPDENPETARRRLHVRISQLRRALGGSKSLVQTVDGGYLFSSNEDCWLDLNEFQSALLAGQQLLEERKNDEAIDVFEKARKIYRGEFLAEDLYIDWTFTLREFYRERFISLLIELSECYAQHGRYRLAIARCQDALMHDPLREAIYVRLMLYHYYAGERTQSLQAYTRCCKILAEELSVDALSSTHKLAEQIQAGSLWTDAESPRYPPPIYEGRLFEVPFALSEAPFVGRDREYAWMIEKLQSRENQIIFIKGEAGIGKSRLVNELVGYLTSQGDRVLCARVTPGARSPFSPLVTALQSLIVQKNLSQISPETLAVLSLFFPDVNQFWTNLPPLSKLSPEGERNRLYDAIHQLIEISDPKPILLLVDDAQRLNLAACELLARISNSTKILLSFRSEEVQLDHPIFKAFGSSQYLPVTLQLKSLRRSDVEKLIRELSQSELPELALEISEQTEGNPLFTIALLQHMFDEGNLFVDPGGGWGITKYETISLPSTIRGTIETRLARLSRTQQQVFDIAAVLGGEFDFKLLLQASQKSEEVLLTILDELIDLAFVIEPRAINRSEFAISHDRYTEVAYASLPDVRRKQIHNRVANAIEQIYADHLAPHYAALADHFERAEIQDKECDYAILAGEQAAAQFSNATALRYLIRSYELTPSDQIDQRFRLLTARVKVYDLLGDRESQNADLDELSELADKLDPPQQAEIHLRWAEYWWILGMDESARSHLDNAIILAQTCGAIEIEAASLLLRGRGEIDQTHARNYLGKARTLAKKAALRAMEGDIVRALGNACFWQNNYEKSRTYFEEALVIHREVGDLRGELSVLNNLGLLFQTIGDLKKSGNYFEQGLEICNKIGDRLAQGVLLANLGNMTAEAGNYLQAQIWLEQACSIREEIQNEEGVGMLLPTLGDILRKQGKYSQAKTQLERALEINVRIEHTPQQCLSLDALSQFYRELGDYAAAYAYFRRALEVLADEQSPNRVRALAHGCLLLLLQGDHAAALEIGEQALTLSAELPQIHATALTNLGHTLAGLQDFEAAAEKYQQALDLRAELLQPFLGIEPLAGLAQLALNMGSEDQALLYIEKILPLLETSPLEGPDQPGQIYLICYQVLQAHQDPKADEILKSAYKLLQKRASAMDNDLLRNSYLENVNAHQEIIQLVQKI